MSIGSSVDTLVNTAKVAAIAQLFRAMRVVVFLSMVADPDKSKNHRVNCRIIASASA
jgi:hypothetical protein